MNKVILIGNVAREVELKYTTTGKAVANFTMAVNDRFNKETTYFFDCIVWNKAAELSAQYLGKGKKAGVVGRLTNRSYETKDGQKRKVTEIVVDEVEFLSPKSGDSSTGNDWSDVGKEKAEDEITW